MVKLNYCLIKPNQISEILYSLSHKRTNTIIAICAGEKMKYFISMINANSNYRNIKPVTFSQYIANQTQNGATLLLMNPPNTFEILNDLLKKAQNAGQYAILSLLQQNKKYLNMISKKVQNLQINNLEFSSNKFVGINDKIRDFVDKGYDMNRAGFYAYGQYINYYRANLLKNIFRTQLINVDELCRSFGFTSALRVKEGNFLKPAARKAKQAQKKAQKRKKKKEAAAKQTEQVIQNEQQIIEQPKTKTKKIKKTHKIQKTLQKKIVKKQNKIK